MKRALLLPAALLVAAMAASAGAAMLKIPLPDLTQRSDQVLRCRVTATQSRWTDDRTTIVTDVTLAAGEAWKGDAPAGGAVALTVRGGEVGDVGIVSEHAPRFERGEDVVLFLARGPDGGLRVTGEEQGKYTVVDGWIVGCEHLPVPLADFRAEVARHAQDTGR